jgi:putative NADH-flavin reductase
MKRLLLYGANGKTGKLILEYALQKGYEVTALVRDPSQVIKRSPRLTLIRGLTTNMTDVKAAMQGCSAVISALGALHESEIFTLRTIVCMKEKGIRRILSLSAFGAGDSEKDTPLIMRIMKKISNLSITYADHNMQEALLQESGLDWTIVRPVRLIDENSLAGLRVSYDGKPTALSITRALVAKFMIDSLDSHAFVQKVPALSQVL